MDVPPSFAATMPAAVYEGAGTVRVRERPVPDPRPGHALVEVAYCGICGSDLHLMLDDWGTPGRIEGHEYTGTVVSVGDGVHGWATGTQVVRGASPRCGRCRACLRGLPSQCEQREVVTAAEEGAFARFVEVDVAALLRVPDGLSLREAALAEPLAVALHAVTRSSLRPGDSVMVMGAGPIGALCIGVLAARGTSPILVVEPGERRADLATALGATVLDPTQLEVFPPWQPERIAERAVDVVLECSGKRTAMEAGLSQLRRGGRMVLVGAGVDPPSFDPNRVVLNELTVTGSFVYDADGFERALELLSSGVLPTDLLIDAADVPLDRLGEAMRALAAGDVAGKVMVVPRLGRATSEEA